MAEQDQFPRHEFAAMLRRLPAYGRLAWALARDPRVSKARRLAVIAGAAYVISPVDLVPGIIPLAGQLDDLFVALAAIRIALDGLKPEWRYERLAAAGLSQVELDYDFATTKAVAAWMVRSGVSAGRKAVAGAVAVGGKLVHLGRRAEQRTRRRFGL